MPAPSATSPIVLRPGPTAGRGGSWGTTLPLRPAPDGSDLKVDLSQLGFVEPLFLLRLRAFIDWHAARGHSIQIAPPTNFGVHSYLSRMRALDELPAGCTCDRLRVGRSNRTDVLIELTALHRPAEADQLDDRLADLLTAHFGAGLASLRSAFAMAASELADNATTHGRNDVGGYVAAQRYKATRCVLSIGDLGVGIPAHLRRVYSHLVDDGQAILEATKEGVTAAETADRAHRGIGYVHMIDEMVKTAVPRASLRIWSGFGRLQIDVRGGRVIRRQARTVDDWTTGTWISVELATG